MGEHEALRLDRFSWLKLSVTSREHNYSVVLKCCTVLVNFPQTGKGCLGFFCFVFFSLIAMNFLTLLHSFLENKIRYQLLQRKANTCRTAIWIVWRDKRFSKRILLWNLDMDFSEWIPGQKQLRVHSRTKCEQSSDPAVVTQQNAINRAMIGHQISPLLQQIIAVSVMSSGREGEGGGQGHQFNCPKSVRQNLPPAPAGFLGFEAALVRPVISGAVIQLPTSSCVNF